VSELTERRAQTSERIKELQRRLQDASTLVADKACVYAIGSFGRGEAKMIGLTPTQRLEWILQQRELADANDIVRGLLDRYENFLKTTNDDEDALVKLFLNRADSRQLMENAYKFGDSVFEALAKIGNNNRFHRVLVV
jgi:hypothetical protein